MPTDCPTYSFQALQTLRLLRRAGLPGYLRHLERNKNEWPDALPADEVAVGLIALLYALTVEDTDLPTCGGLYEEIMEILAGDTCAGLVRESLKQRPDDASLLIENAGLYAWPYLVKLLDDPDCDSWLAYLYPEQLVRHPDVAAFFEQLVSERDEKIKRLEEENRTLTLLLDFISELAANPTLFGREEKIATLLKLMERR